MYKGEENTSNIIKIINSLKLYNEIKKNSDEIIKIYDIMDMKVNWRQ